MKMGLIEPTGAGWVDGSREWEITEAGRVALRDHATSERG